MDIELDESAPRGIAVFGSSSAGEEDALYASAREVGRRVAEAGLPVVNGGYGGVMEAASRGAREAGGEAIGVTCSIFGQRTPNEHLSLEIEEPDLYARTARLFALSRGFVVLEGLSGTLAELALLWAEARAGRALGPIVLLDGAWEELLALLEQRRRIDVPARRVTFIARTAEEAARLALTPLGEGASR